MSEKMGIWLKENPCLKNQLTIKRLFMLIIYTTIIQFVFENKVKFKYQIYFSGRLTIRYQWSKYNSGFILKLM